MNDIDARLSLQQHERGELERLYRDLDTVDAKVRSLLMFNTILLMVVTTAIAGDHVPSQVPWLNFLAWGSNWLKLPALLWIISTACCLAISSLKWVHVSSGQWKDAAKEIAELVVRRQDIYRIALVTIWLASGYLAAQSLWLVVNKW